MKLSRKISKAIVGEFEGAEFGDERLSCRLERIVRPLADEPARGFPQVFCNDASLEGLYRFLGNSRVETDKILAPHYQQTAGRMAQVTQSLVIHDTSVFCFLGEKDREGLYPVTKTKQAFHGHFSLAVSLESDGTSCPLGILGLETFIRRKQRGKKVSKRTQKEISEDLNREGLRWHRMVEAVNDRIRPELRPIHVMDREADIYELFSFLSRNENRYVIRLHHDRKLAESEFERLSEALESSPVVCERLVPLSPRKKSLVLGYQRSQPPRGYRIARLGFAFATVRLKVPTRLKSRQEPLLANVIHVREIDPPQGQQPVDWKLITTEPVQEEKQLLKVVDIYRKRWLIEEYFKALKTGCSFEKRQLESRQTLVNALGLFVPIAYQLLLLRATSRAAESTPASKVLSRNQLGLLRAIYKRPLSRNPTAKEVMLAIAALGGHIRNNGDPGWQVLGRGYQRLLTMEEGWNAAKKM